MVNSNLGNQFFFIVKTAYISYLGIKAIYMSTNLHSSTK